MSLRKYAPTTREPSPEPTPLVAGKALSRFSRPSVSHSFFTRPRYSLRVNNPCLSTECAKAELVHGTVFRSKIKERSLAKSHAEIWIVQTSSPILYLERVQDSANHRQCRQIGSLHLNDGDIVSGEILTCHTSLL